MSTNIAKNKKAYFDYEVLETYDAGLQLRGHEVKSIRQGGVNLKGNFVHVHRGEAFVEGMHIKPYGHASQKDIVAKRTRKLLLKHKEIIAIDQAISTKGVTCVVLELYFKKALVKAKLGIVRGKKKYDKRAAIKERDLARERSRLE